MCFLQIVHLSLDLVDALVLHCFNLLCSLGFSCSGLRTCSVSLVLCWKGMKLSPAHSASSRLPQWLWNRTLAGTLPGFDSAHRCRCRVVVRALLWALTFWAPSCQRLGVVFVFVRIVGVPYDEVILART